MKIAIPTNDKINIEEHFGQCSYFAIYDENKNLIENINNDREEKPPFLLKSKNIDIIICKNLGIKALSLFKSLNITVYLADDVSISTTLELFFNNKLKQASKQLICKGH